MQPLAIPIGMAIMASLVAVGFGATYFTIIRQKRREAHEWQIAPTTSSSSRPAGGGFQPPQGMPPGSGPATDSGTSYQNQGGYQNPQRSPAAKGKVTTYCMIDGRLISNEQ